MGTSGTTDFNPSIDEVIQEAYQRCGLTTTSGYDLKSARRSLNILFSEWGNRGVHLWKVSLHENLLVSGQAAYTVASDVSDVLEAYVSSTATASDTVETSDISLTKIDRSAYAALPNKYSKGQPSQYYVERLKIPKIFLYQTPDVSFYTYLKYYVIKRIEDAGAYSNDTDLIYRFFPAMCSGLAYYLSMKKVPQLTPTLKLIYEDDILRALLEDGQRTSSYISPQTYFGDGV